VLTGASLQNDWNVVHQRTLKWLEASRKTGRPWVVANDEQGDALSGVPPDPGYKGFTGKDARGRVVQTVDDIRKMTLWGNLMAGGAGVEYYFGYLLPENDMVAEDFRSRDRSWDFGRIALDFFRTNGVPFWEMRSADALVGNTTGDNSKWCLAKPGEVYVVYLPSGGTTSLDLTAASGRFTVRWFDPRRGGALRSGSVTEVTAGRTVAIGDPPDSPAEDWAVLVRR
jgi:hypothetical protein